MKRVVLAALALVGIVVVFAAGSWVGWRSATTASRAPQQAALLYYTCPMHPQYHADKPGDCPSCGMRLEPVRADGEKVPSSAGLPAATLTVSPDKQQLIGVRTAVAELSPVNRTIRTVGRVEVDADRVYRLASTVDGVVRELRPNSAGRFVEQDEVLLTFYSSEFLSAQQAFFYALNTRDRVAAAREPTEQASLTSAQLRSAVDMLRNLGMSDTQIAELGKTRKLVRDVELRSPVSGYVLSRSVFPKQQLERGTELYRIADLGRLWVLADLFEGDALYVRPGTSALLTYHSQAASPIHAQISNVLPQFDPTTRTMKVRLEIDNKDMALRPDMLVNVEIKASLPAAVTVPMDALVDSGMRTLVFVDRGNGHFEPRRVATGWRADDRVEIVRGLAPGEHIVVSGNFLLDSESRMKLAGMDVADPDTDPVCGMTVDRGRAVAAGLTVVHGEESVFFCSEHCKKAFEENPAKYLAGPGAAPALPRTTLPPMTPASRPRTRPTTELPDYLRGGDVPNVLPAAARGRTIFAMDPVCSAEVDTTAPDPITSEYKGRKYYFFSADCKAEFDRDPAKYAK